MLPDGGTALKGNGGGAVGPYDGRGGCALGGHVPGGLDFGGFGPFGG